MPRGIILFGAPGAGKTTLGRLAAEQLSYPYFDIDDYIWRRDTEIPFTKMYSREEKATRLMEAIADHNHFVMAGSMDSFHAPFDPLFELAVLVTADVQLRLDRLHRRELALFGCRILKGGDMYEEHRRFLDSAARYDTDGSPNLKTHLAWAENLPCPTLRIEGGNDLAANTARIIEEYIHCTNNIL
ncbi:MAG: shikimate kinase [Ruminococcaceae bacterium]|nr:shikimate kinase [Oscillospiraceae bacterium]